LNLHNNRLRTIPKQLVQFKSLTVLDFQANRLSDEISLGGKLENLTTIKFHGNKITSVSSTSFFQHLPSLTQLQLSYNSLTAIPAEISLCVNLQDIDISSNKISSLPDSFSGMTKLTKFSASDNNLTELPATLCKLESVQTVFLYGNSISKIPAISWKKPELVNLEGNSLTSIPFRLSKADTLVVTKNPLGASAKKEIHGELTSEENSAREKNVGITGHCDFCNKPFANHWIDVVLKKQEKETGSTEELDIPFYGRFCSDHIVDWQSS